MEVNRLLGDEIVYELTIRGLPILRTVVENRNTLRGALRAEREGIAPAPTSSVQLDFNQELATCNRKLIDLHNDIQNFDVQNRENDYRRISSRLYHIDNRLRRLSPSTQEEEERRRGLIGRVMQLVDAIGTLYDNLTSLRVNQEIVSFEQGTNREVSILDDPNPIIPEMRYSTATTPGTSQVRDQDAIGNTASAVNSLIDLGAPNTEALETSIPQNRNPSTSAEPNRSVVRFSEDVPSQHLSRNDLSSSPMLRPQPNLMRNPYYPPPAEERMATLNTTQDFSERLRNLRLSPVGYPSEEYPSRFVDISRWNLRYDGETSVTDFLERLEEMRNSRDISQSRLLNQHRNFSKVRPYCGIVCTNLEHGRSLWRNLKAIFNPSIISTHCGKRLGIGHKEHGNESSSTWLRWRIYSRSLDPRNHPR